MRKEYELEEENKAETSRGAISEGGGREQWEGERKREIERERERDFLIWFDILPKLWSHNCTIQE